MSKHVDQLGVRSKNDNDLDISDAVEKMMGHKAVNRARSASPHRGSSHAHMDLTARARQQPVKMSEDVADEDNDLLGGGAWMHDTRKPEPEHQNATGSVDAVRVNATSERVPEQVFAIGERVAVRTQEGRGTEVYGVVCAFNESSGVYLVDEFRVMLECTQDRYACVCPWSHAFSVLCSASEYSCAPWALRLARFNTECT
jgi:hypothetical protein